MPCIPGRSTTTGPKPPPLGGMIIVLVEHNRLGDSDNTPLTLIGHHGGVSTANLVCAPGRGFAGRRTVCEQTLPPHFSPIEKTAIPTFPESASTKMVVISSTLMSLLSARASIHPTLPSFVPFSVRTSPSSRRPGFVGRITSSTDMSEMSMLALVSTLISSWGCFTLGSWIATAGSLKRSTQPPG